MLLSGAPDLHLAMKWDLFVQGSVKVFCGFLFVCFGFFLMCRVCIKVTVKISTIVYMTAPVCCR